MEPTTEPGTTRGGILYPYAFGRGEACPVGARPKAPVAKVLRACRFGDCIDRHGGRHYHDPIRGIVY